MVAQLYLIAPPDAEPQPFAETLKQLFAVAGISALLLPRGTRSDAAYQTLVSEIGFLGQEAGCAVLIEGEPSLVRALGADGLHSQGPASALRTAISALKPDLIVGAGNILTRHDAMSIGELDIDYIMFGPLSGVIAPEARELAGWWAETMVIPSVLSDPEATAETADSGGCEFLALSDSLWRASDPAAALAAIATRLENQ